MVLVLATLELAILVIVMVVVVADLEDGNGAHRFAGLFTLDWAKQLMSNLVVLYLLLLWEWSLDLFEGAAFFVNFIGLE